MRKLLSSEKLRFITKIAAIHVLTYVVVTIIAIPLTLDYAESMMEMAGFKPLDEINIGAVFIAQIIRGLLLGIVIWWVKDSIIGKKWGWLKLWAILVILGIFNTYAPTHGSIQGMIYLAPIEDLPVSASLGMLEVLAQPLLFSIAVFFLQKSKARD
ncbi:hypothetical protein FWD07_00880 [Candidatus Saccharibacteria bacterium]|nr:hypothetical protein [Candidatus Saccharibacteria bacterium]